VALRARTEDEGQPAGALASCGGRAYPDAMRIAVAAVSLLAVLVAVPLLAQAPVVFVDLGIDLWPEYDRPGVLVIYRGTIAPGVRLPAVMSLQIPAAAGEPSALAERDPSGQLTVVQYQREVEGEWATITFAASRPVIQVEYYDPGIERQDAVRSFTFTWPGDYEIGVLNVSVQQPDLAQNMTTAPPPSSQGTSADGLLYLSLDFPAVEAGRTIDVAVSYEKVSDQLTVETMPPIEQATPVTSSTAPAIDTSVIVIALGALLAAAVVAGVFLWRRSYASGAPSAMGTTGPIGGHDAGDAATGPSGSAPRGSGGGRGAAFCTQCGAAAGSRDRFCGGCGNALSSS